MSYTSLGFVSPSSTLDRLDRVNNIISSFDNDVQKDITSSSGSIGGGQLGIWTDFTNAPKEQALDFNVAPPRGWRWFYSDSSSLLSRITDSEDINKRIGEFEIRFVELYDKMVGSGLKTGVPRPTPGITPPSPEHRPADTLETWIKVAALLGGLVAAGYFMRSLPQSRGRSR